MDIYGDHALTCRKSGWYLRHNLVRDLLRELLELCGFKVSPGEPVISGTELERADLLIVSSDQGRPEAVDTAVSHPLQSSTINAEVDPKTSLAKVVVIKKMRYGAKCDKAGWALTPVVALTTGQWSSSTASLISSMTKRLSMSSGKDSASCAELLWARLSVTLMRGCSFQLMRCFPDKASLGRAQRGDGPISLDWDLRLIPQ
jgi:hypothetical protein